MNIFCALFLGVSVVDGTNVVIIGKTGVGKSTIFNHLVGEEVSEIGIGDVGTRDLISYRIPDSDKTLWDTRGLFDGRISAIEVLKQIQDRVVSASTILLAIKMPLVGGPSRTTAFPDMDVVELLFSAISNPQVFQRNVVLLFTFAQFESRLAEREVEDFIKGEFSKKGIPVPRTILFAGDDPNGQPYKWSKSLRQVVVSNYVGPWVIGFNFGAIDAATFGDVRSR